ncbi:MAG: Crp/Fnr family transcriptional regulator [Clostridiaceae bacterium]
MEKYTESLKKCIIFQNIEENKLQTILKEISAKAEKYSKNQTIALEGDACNSIGIVLEGTVEIQKIFLSGKTLTISKLSQGDIFGEVIVFSKFKVYPSTIAASSKATVMFISRNEISRICTMDTDVLTNFMELLSGKILMLNNKIKNLSFDTLREKICSYLMDEYQKQKSKNIFLPLSRKELAEYLGVQRPSLSREFINMKDEGLIDFYRNNVTLLDVSAIENYLY